MARSDAELVIASLDGDAKAFEEIVRRYQTLVFNIVYHYLGRRNEVEDLAQEVFLKVHRSLSRFDTGRPLKAWIGRITSNACLDELRKAKIRKVSSFADMSQDEEERVQYLYEKTARGDSLSQVEADESFRLLHKALEELADKDRMAFVLREMEGLTYKEIASAMKASQVAIRIRVSRARKKLQERVRALLGDRAI